MSRLKETLVKKANLIIGLVLGISIILNILLLTTPVFNGTYTANEERINKAEYNTTTTNYKWKIVFYNNTYTNTFTTDNQLYGVNVGFYAFIPKSKYKKTSTNIDLEHDVILLKQNGTQDTLMYRHSVFKLSVVSNDKINYYCNFAIFLQVILCIIYVGSTASLIYLNKA